MWMFYAHQCHAYMFIPWVIPVCEYAGLLYKIVHDEYLIMPLGVSSAYVKVVIITNLEQKQKSA